MSSMSSPALAMNPGCTTATAPVAAIRLGWSGSANSQDLPVHRSDRKRVQRGGMCLRRAGEAGGNDRPHSLDRLVASLLAEVVLQRRSLLRRPRNLSTVQDLQVALTHLRELRPKPVCHPCRRQRVRVRLMGSIERHAIVLTHRAQRPFAAPKAVHVLVEHIWVDHQHALRAAHQLEQPLQPIPLRLPVEDRQIEACIERDDRHSAA